VTTTNRSSLAQSSFTRQHVGFSARSTTAAPEPRVLQVVLSLNPGGTERLVVELARRLTRQIPMAICCLDDEGDWASELSADNVPVTALHRAAGFRPALSRAIATVARQHGANVIHCHHYSPFVYSCFARFWKPGCRVIFTEHGRLSDAAPSAKRRIANQVLRRLPSGVFTVSEDLRQHIIAEGFAPRAVSVIYNGISVGPPPDPATREQIRRTVGASPETMVIGTIARLDRVKDLGTLIEATRQCGRTVPVLLLIVGDGPERARLEEVTKACGAEPYVRFLGHRDDARRWLAGCDAYVNSSVSEGVSLTILEAMAAGLPVVATRVGGTPEVVDATCARLVSPRDPDAMAGALLDLIRQPALRDQMGRAARTRVEALFTLERMVDEYRGVYHKVL
jgi:glycosyltransferase involved in cell wall biosynthesis